MSTAFKKQFAVLMIVVVMLAAMITFAERAFATPPEDVCVPAEEQVIEHEAVVDLVEHEAEYEYIEHEAVTETWYKWVKTKHGYPEYTWSPTKPDGRWQPYPSKRDQWSEVKTIEEAWTEKKLVSEAWTEEVVIKEAWTEVIPAVECPVPGPESRETVEESLDCETGLVTITTTTEHAGYYRGDDGKVYLGDWVVTDVTVTTREATAEECPVEPEPTIPPTEEPTDEPTDDPTDTPTSPQPTPPAETPSEPTTGSGDDAGPSDGTPTATDVTNDSSGGTGRAATGSPEVQQEVLTDDVPVLAETGMQRGDIQRALSIVLVLFGAAAVVLWLAARRDRRK